MTHVFTRLALGLVILAASSRADAQLARRADAEPARVVVIKTGDEPACLDLADVAAAIDRHPAFTAHVGARLELDGVELVLRGTTGRLEVTLRSDARELTRVVENTPCGSLADVIAAFVTAALAPVPELAPALPGLVSFPESGPPGLAVPDFATSGSFAANAELDVHVRSERALLLSEELRSYTPTRYRVGAVALGGMIAIPGGLSLLLDAPPIGHGLVLAGTSTVVASTIVLYAKPESATANAVGTLGYVVGAGTMLVGYGFFNDPEQREHYDAAPAFLGAGLFASGLWAGIDYFREPPVSPGALFEMRRRLRTPGQRARLSDSELAEYERTFRRSRISKKYLLPPVLAGAAVVAYSFTLDDPGEQESALLLGTMHLALIGVFALIPDPVTRYTRRLHDAGIDVKLAPLHAGAGLGVSGRF